MSKYLNKNGVATLWYKTKEKIAEVKTEVKTEALSLDEINEVLNTFVFYIGAGEYHAVEGMTWQDYVGSSYNPSEVSEGLALGIEKLEIYGDYVQCYHDANVCDENGAVKPTDFIVPGKTYSIAHE